MEDMDKDTVDWQPNFDGTLQEPVVLPTKFPNFLVNGGSGIAVGMATNVPTYNLGEICNGILAILDNREISDDELFGIIPGPDFPTGAIIMGRTGAYKAHTTGLLDTPEETLAALLARVKKVAAHLKTALGCDGFHILQNNGAAAGQTVGHIHFHIVPRRNGDPIEFANRPGDMEHLKALAARIGVCR